MIFRLRTQALMGEAVRFIPSKKIISNPE